MHMQPSLLRKMHDNREKVCANGKKPERERVRERSKAIETAAIWTKRILYVCILHIHNQSNATEENDKEQEENKCEMIITIVGKARASYLLCQAKLYCTTAYTQKVPAKTVNNKGKMVAATAKQRSMYTNEKS